MDQPSGHDAPPPASKPSDSEALRGTRFEFGGRRPYSFAPPRVAERAPAPGRPLPGIGTVAIGHVSRIVPYGAFVDFLGFRGMIHISQLQPGQRVERVEDVVDLQDEVQVRVIGVDPERRHINLVLVAKLGSATPAQRAEAAAAAVASPPAEPEAVEVLAEPDAEPATESASASEPVPALSTVAPVEVVQKPRVTPAPASASRPVSRPAQRPPARPAPQAEPKPAAPAVAQHGARAIRRELVDPRHPMSRLLAAAGQARTRTAEKERARLEAEIAPLNRPAPAPPEPPRPVHVFGPDPEPEQDQPATLEALAARFGQRREAPTPKPTKGPAANNAAERSRQQREKQAQILARLREDSAKFTK